MRFVTHLEAAIDGTILPADQIATMHKNRPLWVRYDLPAIRAAVQPQTFSTRPPTLWRYRELLPIVDDSNVVSLGEGVSPILPARRLGEAIGLHDLWIKDESQLPTGSFKSRGMALAVSMAAHFGLRRLAVPTAGNAGGALAAYGARAGMEIFVFMPSDTPGQIQRECLDAGARVVVVDGLITDCARMIRQGMDAMGWFDVATLKEPYRIEGKKTMGLELAEQFGWELPAVVIYPTGGGTGLIGMWKAFQELRELGWLKAERMPRMIAVQSDGCAPIVRAYDAGARFADPWEAPRTASWGIRVPSAIGDFMILDAIRASEGRAVAVPENTLLPEMRRGTALEGIPFCSEAGACIAAARRLAREGAIRPDERTVIFNTCAAAKYQDSTPPDLPCLPPEATLPDIESAIKPQP